MAVYRRSYKGYTGQLTPAWSHFLILTRNSYARLFRSPFLVIFMVACLFYPLACLAYIYLSHNPAFLRLLGIPGGRLPGIDGRFFYFYCNVQGGLAYLLVALVSPSLISWDLTNGALPLYFCRPFSRAEYFAGKMGVLLSLLSLITWIPGLMIYAIEGSIAGWAWTQTNLWMAGAIFQGMLVWIVAVSLLGLALTAWVKWKIAAGALILGVFFAGAGFGAAIDTLLRTKNGALIDLSQVIHTVWSDLLRYDSGTDMSVVSAWIVLGIVCVFSLWLLARRLRPFEVVK